MADNPYQQSDDQNPYRNDNTVRTTHPSQPQPVENVNAPPQKKSRTGLFVGCGVLGFFLLVLAFIGGIFYFVTGLMKSSDAYVEAVQRAKKNPFVITAIGEPMSEGFFTTGSINLHNDDGSAKLHIPLSGPKGSGTIYVNATKTSGVWYYLNVTFTPSDNSAPIQLGPVTEQLPEKPQ